MTAVGLYAASHGCPYPAAPASRRRVTLVKLETSRCGSGVRVLANVAYAHWSMLAARNVAYSALHGTSPLPHP